MAVKSDYDRESVDCCLSHLIELFTILGEFRGHLVVVGGWVPYFLCNNPDEEHTGSMDIDLALEFDAITEGTYQTILATLNRHGFVQGKQPFIYVKQAMTEAGMPFTVEVDLLAGEYSGTARVHRHQRAQDVQARKARGVDLVFQEPVLKLVRGRLPDGAVNEVTVRIAGVVPFIVMKGMSIWARKEQKDAYDIYYIVSHYPSGLDGLVKVFEPYKHHGLVKEGLGKIKNKFGGPENIGPVWVAEFMEIEDAEEIARVRRDAYEKASYLLDRLEISEYKGE